MSNFALVTMATERKRNWFQRTFVPFFIKKPHVYQVNHDSTLAIEKVGYIFGWSWKTWKYSKLTGRVFKAVRSWSADTLQDEQVLPEKPEKVIIYRSSDFTPIEFELCMINSKFVS